MQRSDIACPVCKKGKTYYDNNRLSSFCDNPDCDFVLSIEDALKGKSKTDLSSFPEKIIKELIVARKIPKGIKFPQKNETYETTFTCQNCGVGVDVHIPKGVRVSDYRPNEICGNCGCKIAD